MHLSAGLEPAQPSYTFYMVQIPTSIITKGFDGLWISQYHRCAGFHETLTLSNMLIELEPPPGDQAETGQLALKLKSIIWVTSISP